MWSTHVCESACTLFGLFVNAGAKVKESHKDK